MQSREQHVKLEVLRKGKEVSLKLVWHPPVEPPAFHEVKRE
jgi:hypothetical protein